MAAFGGWSYSLIVRGGLHWTGLERPGMWGNLITDFVFWVGIAHSGTLISAILFLFRAKFRTAVYRVAEMMTVFAVMAAAFATPLVVSVHSVVSWDFAVALTPGWHSTLFPPYFVAGAILSGVAMVITILVPLRRAFRLEALITQRHLDMLARLVILTGLIVTYSHATEIVLALQAPPSDPERSTFVYRMTGAYAPVFWTMVTGNCGGPLLLLLPRVRRTTWSLIAISLAINVGMWLERFNIVVTSLSHDRLPFDWRVHVPTWVEWAITFGAFGWFFFLFLIGLKSLPPVSIAELKEEVAHDAAHRAEGGEAPHAG